MGEDFFEATPRKADVIPLSRQREKREARKNLEEFEGKYLSTLSNSESAKDGDLYRSILSELGDGLKAVGAEDRISFFRNVSEKIITPDEIEAIAIDLVGFQLEGVITEEEGQEILKVIEKAFDED